MRIWAIGALLASIWAPSAASSAAVSGAADADYVVDAFAIAGSSGIPTGWEQFSFKKGRKPTVYVLRKEGGNAFVAAESAASGTSLIKRFSLDPKEYPILSWRWRVDRVVEKADGRVKGGDDFAARVYVGFKYRPAKAKGWEKFKYGVFKSGKGFYPPEAILFYVWDNKHEIGTSFENAFSDKGWMMVVETGEANVGKWVSEERDVYDDYRKLFGTEPPEIEFVALMTDTDNTGESASAAYDDIRFKKRNGAALKK